MKKVLDILTFGLYNNRINKQTQGEKIMADSAVNYTEDMVATMTEQYEAEPTMATVAVSYTHLTLPTNREV